jgi:hypothetical protein
MVKFLKTRQFPFNHRNPLSKKKQRSATLKNTMSVLVFLFFFVYPIITRAQLICTSTWSFYEPTLSPAPSGTVGLTGYLFYEGSECFYDLTADMSIVIDRQAYPAEPGPLTWTLTPITVSTRTVIITFDFPELNAATLAVLGSTTVDYTLVHSLEIYLTCQTGQMTAGTGYGPTYSSTYSIKFKRYINLQSVIRSSNRINRYSDRIRSRIHRP